MGCSFISELMQMECSDIKDTVLYEVLKPIQHITIRWMADGILEENNDDFFIVHEPSVDDWFSDEIIFSKTNKLDFLGKTKLDDIYNIGRHIRLLLKHKVSKRFNDKITLLRDHIQRTLIDQKESLLLKLSEDLTSIQAQTSILLLEMFVNEFNLFMYFEGLKNYMLFGRGDFYAYVVYKLDAFFEKHAIHNYQLKGIVEDAYELTSAANDSIKIFDCLKYKTVLGGSILDWHSLKFEYIIHEPLTKLFSPCINIYGDIFEFLWRLKEIDYTIVKFWYKFTLFTKKIHIGSKLKPVLRNVNALLFNMINCIHEIQNFTFEIINEKWKIFQKIIKNADSVETIMEEHKIFLNTLIKFLLDASLKNYVESFQRNVKRMVVIQNFTTLFDNNGINSQYDSFVEKFLRVQKNYKVDLDSFLLKLINNEEQFLGTLAMRIDFNDYYLSNTTCVYRAAPCIIVS
ncbi:gamma-tubulin complex component 3 homolog [Daktulosphaira vitifoliae]|uniref:gamma-tubulin complex component 3 homolog n=1 Tax=Daktulosphaira vitifoliae TaxID=58002 RepID=UPI0021AA8461|nr:gamma-tubulin complex component 3 homolog [Daktulosphaira vitifoliae]